MYKRAFFALAMMLVTISLAGLWSINRLGGWRYTAHRLYTQQTWPTITQRTSQLELLQVPDRSVIMLGDSHMANGEWSMVFPELSVANRGIPGASLTLLEELLGEDSQLVNASNLEHAQWIVIQVGTNDLLFHSSAEVTKKYYAFAQALQGRLQIEAGRVDSTRYLPPPKILLCTVPGVNNQVRWTGIEPAEVHRLNESLRGVAADLELDIYDLAQELGTQDGIMPSRLTDDGVHLRGEGYLLWSNGLRDYLVRGTTFAQ